MTNKIILFLAGIVFTLQSCSNNEPESVSMGETWSFVVFSDPQQGYGVYKLLARNISRINPIPKVAICCGDIMVKSANEVNWLNFLRYSKSILDKMPLLLARGNHEGNDPASETILHQLGQIKGKHFYYTYREKDAFFIILDTEIKDEERAILGDELKWLKYQLDSVSAEHSIVHIFLFMHHPLYPQGLHKGENLHNADSLHQIFLRHTKIRAIFAGHDHMYNKYVKDGEIYITTGGAGGTLYSGYGGDYHHFVKVSFFRDSLRINIKTIGIFNEVVEDFDI